MSEILSNPQEPDNSYESPAPSAGWSPCDGCTFAGEVTEISTYGTARVTDDLESEGEPLVSFVENEGSKDERRTGAARVILGGGSYGTGDGLEAVGIVVDRMRRCAERKAGPVVGPKARILGIGLGTMKACGAFYAQENPGDVPRSPDYLHVKNA